MSSARNVARHVSKEELQRSQSETQKAAARNKLVVFLAFCVYALLVGGSTAILPSAFTESALVAAREAAVPHWCGFAGFLAVFCVELVSVLISTDAAKTRVTVITLGCSLMGAITYLTVALEVAPVMLGPASGFAVYPTKMLTWIVSTSLMIYVVWNAGDTSIFHLLQTLAFNAAMLLAGLIGFCSPVQYVPFAFAFGMVMFCGMGYGQWNMIGQDSIDDLETHRANMAMFKVKCIMVGCWLLFPAIYALQFFSFFPRAAVEAAMAFADVLAKCILTSAIQQGFLCGSADRKQSLMQQMALDLVEDLKEADKRKDRFLATMTHELRTPLNGIVGITESLLLNFSETVDERVVKGIQTVRDSGKRFSQLVSNILDSASLSESKLRLVLKPVHLWKIVDEVALLIEPLLRNNTKLMINVPTTLPQLDADYERLLQIMFNLMGNACKFTDDGEISVRATAEGGMMRIVVKDTGAGIPSDKHQVIFKPFEQVDNSRTRVHGGTGLGLSLARSLVEAHEGTLTVRSELKKGSTFTALIPLKSRVKEAKTELIGGLGPRIPEQTDGSAEPVNTCPSSDSKADYGNIGQPARNLSTNRVVSRLPSRSASLRNVMRESKSPRSSIFRSGFDSIADGRYDGAQSGILSDWLEARKEEAVSCLIRTELQDEAAAHEVLVVDDEVSNHTVVKELLESTGLKVSSAMSGYQAIDMLTQRYQQGGTANFPDMVLMDLMMPGISGQQTMESIREQFPGSQMPIIMLSANDDEPSIVSALEKGCQDYIVKPFKSAELLARVGLQLYTLKSGMKELEVSRLEQLLRELLPESVILRLKQGQQLIADKIPNATVLSFNFNQPDVKAAKETIAILDELFSGLDAVAENHRLSKVEALGGKSIYTLMAGHEDLSLADHAARVVRASLDIIELAARVRMPNGDKIAVQVGIHTGPAIAGMIGSKGPRYCLVGPALEISSKLEQCGHDSCVLISDSTYHNIKNSLVSTQVRFSELQNKINVGDDSFISAYVMHVGGFEEALMQDRDAAAARLLQAQEVSVENISPDHRATTPNEDLVVSSSMQPTSQTMLDSELRNISAPSSSRSNLGLLSCFSAPSVES